MRFSCTHQEHASKEGNREKKMSGECPGRVAQASNINSHSHICEFAICDVRVNGFSPFFFILHPIHVLWGVWRVGEAEPTNVNFFREMQFSPVGERERKTTERRIKEDLC
jgi:hypothetical protein